MGRLIIVSNRTGDFKSGVQSGGLAVAVCDVLRARGGIWFGTCERAARARRTRDETAPPQEVAPGVCRDEVPIEKDTYRAYYRDYANALLWPICHNRIDLARFDGGSFPSYREVNDRIAAAMVGHLSDDDVIWVHDYHLIPLGEHLRNRGVMNPIGFFLHIPFPPGDVFAAIPQHESLAESLSHYDLVGFQTENDVGSFLGYLQRHVSARILNDGRIRVKGRVIRVGSFPIGIDPHEFASAAAAVGEDDGPANVRDPDMRHVIGVDRLDYSKGLTQRFHAFARFLETNAHRRRHVTFTQIAPATRQGVRNYAHIRNELERLAGSINGRFGDLDWMPIRYICRAFPRPSLARLHRRAKVGLVTPTQDGMNLVAKEYVAAQDPADPGVLILSKFAGAAAQLGAALIVNPHDIDACARSIETALQMPIDERQSRYREMFETIAKYDLQTWSASFLQQLDSAAREGLARPATVRFRPPSPNVRAVDGGPTRLPKVANGAARPPTAVGRATALPSARIDD